MLGFSFLIVLFFLFPPSSVFSSADNFTGRVIEVADGDSITILTHYNEEKRIRLGGIDCPESSQLHGDEAKHFLSSIVLERRVRILPDGIDDYGRTVATVLLNGENVNRRIIAFGQGWVYRKYCTADYCNDWLKLEETARNARVGLWRDDNPRPPWEWRAEQKSKDRDKGGFINKFSAFLSSNVASGRGSSGVYHGNRRSHVFHGPSCQDYNCKNCTVMLGSVQDAVNAGYRAHGECVKE